MIRRLQMEENYSTTVEIESMDEIIRLFGAFDENLKVIEAETGAAIRSDSESIIIEGEEEAVQIAASVV